MNNFKGMELNKFRDYMAKNNYNTVFYNSKGTCEVYDGNELVASHKVELLWGSWYIK